MEEEPGGPLPEMEDWAGWVLSGDKQSEGPQGVTWGTPLTLPLGSLPFTQWLSDRKPRSEK